MACSEEIGSKRETPDMKQGETDRASSGRLRARPSDSPTGAPFPPGLHALRLDDERDALLYAPSSDGGQQGLPLVVMLHGAGGSAQQGLAPFLPLAEEGGLILLAPQSRRETWDVIRGGFGPDIAFLDAALEETFSRHLVDPNRIAVEGFSDGASYALSVGLTNGDLFKHIIAFSPGFMSPGEEQGTPRVFVSHGVYDNVLPIGRTSRQIVPRLEAVDYDVRYREFDGGHSVPAEIAEEALAWWLDA